jgi:phosphonate transport system substrate-binding protein
MLNLKITGGLLAAGVIALAASAASAQECKNPDQLVFSIIPTEETTQEVDLYKPVIDALRANTGKKIEFFMPTSYASVVEAMINGWVHVGVHGPNSYVIAHGKDPKVEVFATYAKVAGGDGHLQEEGPGYRAVLLSRKDSGLDTIEKLKGKVVGLVEPASTSGDLLPRVVFGKKIGSDLESYFSKVVYTGGHDLATLAVKEGRVDAAFVATHRFDNVVDRDLVKLDEFNVLWQSPFIPQDPFTYRTDLCPEILDAIKKTFLTLHETPGAQKFLDNVKSKRFVAVSDADYDIIRELAAAKKK